MTVPILFILSSLQHISLPVSYLQKDKFEDFIGVLKHVKLAKLFYEQSCVLHVEEEVTVVFVEFTDSVTFKDNVILRLVELSVEFVVVVLLVVELFVGLCGFVEIY